MPIEITEEMILAAKRESERRNPHIRHHFNLPYMSGPQRDFIGFLGEFACKKYLGLDWKAEIRANYDTPDSGDTVILNRIIDIKTETIPDKNLMLLIQGEVGDHQPFGRRLINEGQVQLLRHYDYVVWGAFPRDSCHLWSPHWWYPLGYLESAYILEHYRVTIDTPFGGKYHEPCLNVRQSELKNLDGLMQMIGSRPL